MSSLASSSSPSFSLQLPPFSWNESKQERNLRKKATAPSVIGHADLQVVADSVRTHINAVLSSVDETIQRQSIEVDQLKAEIQRLKSLSRSPLKRVKHEKPLDEDHQDQQSEGKDEESSEESGLVSPRRKRRPNQKITNAMIKVPFPKEGLKLFEQHQFMLDLFKEGGELSDRRNEWLDRGLEVAPILNRDHRELMINYWAHLLRIRDNPSFIKDNTVTNERTPGLLHRWDANGRCFIRFNA